MKLKNNALKTENYIFISTFKSHPVLLLNILDQP